MMECRLCLSSLPFETYVPIYNNTQSIERHIWNCCHLKVEQGDGFPDSICLSCESHLESFANFKKACIQNDEILRRRFSKSQIKMEEITVEDYVWEENVDIKPVINERQPSTADKDFSKQIDLNEMNNPHHSLKRKRQSGSNFSSHHEENTNKCSQKKEIAENKLIADYEDEYDDSDSKFEIKDDTSDTEDFVEELDLHFDLCESEDNPVIGTKCRLDGSSQQPAPSIQWDTKTSKLENEIVSSTNIKSMFSLFINEEIVKEICDETNRHINNIQLLENNIDAITEDELYAFVGLMLASGKNIITPQKINISEMWTKETPFAWPFFSAALSRDRFYKIYSYIRFDNKQTRQERFQASSNKLEPIKVIFDKFRDACILNYTQSSNILVKKHLVTYRGNCPFRVFEKSERGRYGILIWTAVDSSTSYINNLEIHTGAGTTSLHKAYKMKRKKHAVVNLDKNRYCCAKATKRWPFRVFMELLDMAALNAYLLWINRYPNWKIGSADRQKLFIKELCLELVKPNILKRKVIRQTYHVKQQYAIDVVLAYCEEVLPKSPVVLTSTETKVVSKSTPSRGSCRFCPLPAKKRTRLMCYSCGKAVCLLHRIGLVSCPDCDRFTYLQNI
ncbi:uncharacterized protein LOC143920894 isoform X2 [Arctopsyche grandis]|uniref:uncharacterized protein LOC143920894 isoform X1 n=1 Tax=Arctopsyche grandis TaxID=121162 RepID=UPI00406D84BA